MECIDLKSFELSFKTTTADGLVLAIREKVKLIKQLIGREPNITVFGIFKSADRHNETIFGDRGILVGKVGTVVLEGPIDQKWTRFTPAPDADRSEWSKEFRIFFY